VAPGDRLAAAAVDRLAAFPGDALLKQCVVEEADHAAFVLPGLGADAAGMPAPGILESVLGSPAARKNSGLSYTSPT
jgi:hypothetical protein